ncbi:MAG: hypothetical protein M4D80_16655 [Myxococcota bacterium]|nr:hypothetical protein [Myxococcota bacterium]
MSTLLDELKTAWEYVSSIEPALGKVSMDELRRVEGSIASVERYTGEIDELDAEDAESAQSALAVLYSRGAAIAVAAGAEGVAQRWFDEGESHALDEAYAAQFMDGRRDPERYRKLVQGRWQIANHREGDARKLWREVVKANNTDAIALAANAEQKAPRALKDGQMPSLWTYNGIGVGFSGSRDRWDDGSYATTHCFKIFYIPIIPLKAYRVVDGQEDNEYFILAREQLSTFARVWRWGLLGMVVLGIAWFGISSHLNDPDRLARIRWDESMEKVAKSSPEDALRELDDRMKDYELWRVGRERAQKAGAEMVKLAAGMVKKPFTKDAVDQATRVVRRYEALPAEVKGGVAQDAIVATLDKWTKDLGESLDTAEARLELLRHAERLADTAAHGPIAAKIETTRLAAADAKAETAPLEALAIYVEKPSADALARANKIVEKIAESPALLVDASTELRAWISNVGDSPLRQTVQDRLALGNAAKEEAQAEKVTPKQLEAMLKKNPWNQWATLALANVDIDAGKLDAAATRLRAIGKPNAMVRDVRQMLGQLASALGQLEEADELLTGLLGSRLARFAKVAAELETQQQALISQLKNGTIPYDLQRQLDSTPEAQQRDIVTKWLSDQMENDPKMKSLRDQYMALNDVVPACLAAGTVKLRRAQGLSGAARDAMLGEAERMFLAIRTEAEGQPEFAIGLGEIYARLGKTKESEEQFEQILAMKNPELSLRVARVYRGIGSAERAKTVAKQVFDTATEQTRDNAAVLLGIMSDTRGEEDEAEAWFRKADQKDPMVKTSLLELEARRLLRAGKYNECAAKYAQVAKQHLATANAMDIASFNNAALAHQNRFACSGDASALADAESTLEKAYRVRGDEPIVVANLAELHDGNGRRRVLAKRIDMRALHGVTSETEKVLSLLLGNADRDAVLADLNADAGIRRSIDLFKQYEVLAPNSSNAYEKLLTYAYERRDEAALTALLERVKRAKGLDTSEAARNREKFQKGEFDEQVKEHATTTLARLDALLAKGKLDPKTRAAALIATGNLRIRASLYEGNIPGVAAGRKATQEAGKLWPAVASPSFVIAALIDEAALEADTKTWTEMRRTYSAVAALTKLAADKSPIAAKVMASKQWAEVHTTAQSDTARPSVDDLRIARLLGDTALETRAKAVLDDKLTRLSYEIGLVLDPTGPGTKEDLAYLDKR